MLKTLIEIMGSILDEFMKPKLNEMHKKAKEVMLKRH